MKILALDLGNVWIGSAISDGLGITCKPYKTISYKNPETIITFLLEIIRHESVSTIVLGRPITNKGEESEQTKQLQELGKVIQNGIAQKLSTPITWIWWDERLSSKRAQALQQGKFKTKEMKEREHSVAAAFVLQSYLDHREFIAQD